MKTEIKDGDGQILHEGERVFTYSMGGRCYGTFHRNVDYPYVT